MRFFPIPTIFVWLVVVGVTWTAPAGAFEKDVCIATNGKILRQLGTATCEATGKGSLATTAKPLQGAATATQLRSEAITARLLPPTGTVIPPRSTET